MRLTTVRHRCFRGSAVICMLLAASSCLAQEPGAVAWTLGQVLERADAKYPAIVAAQAQRKAAQQAIGIARAAYLPRTDVLWQTNRATANNILGLLLPQATIPSVTGTVLSPDVTRSAWNSAGGALLSWQPFDFGAREAAVSAAEQGSLAATQAEALTRLRVGVNAGSAFFDLAAAEELVKAAQANVRRYEAFAKVVHVLADNALRAGADASQADAQLALARSQLIQLQTQEAVRRSALAQYLQADQASANIDASRPLAALPISDLGATAPASHPAVLEEHALELQQQAKEHQVARSYVPVVSTSGVVFGRGAGTSSTAAFPGGSAGLAPNVFNWALGAQVSFAPFDFFSLRDQRRMQSEVVQAEHARYSQAISDVTVALQQAEATLAGARRLADITPIELKAAQTSEAQQQVRYRSALSSVVDVSAAESVLAQAEGDDAIARLGVWRAELGVAAAQGDLRPFLALLKQIPDGR